MAGELDEYSAMFANPINQTIGELTDQFTQTYTRSKELYDPEKLTLSNALMHAIIRQHSLLLLIQFLWAVLWSCSRLLGSMSIRWFLIWLQDYNAGKVGHREGWLWAFVLVLSIMAIAISNAQNFWNGGKVVWKVKMSVAAVIHSKLLELRSSSLAKITTGHVVNLASNDAQRLCEAFWYWPGIVLGPIETIAILILLSSVLGFAPTVSGLSCLLALVPLEWLLSKHRAKLRVNVVKITDKRIIFMSELITGALAVKMFGWEDPLLEKVNRIRNKEHRMLQRINYINASTLALYGFILD